MKILHALVGYLTLTALPFALASPLAAIDYNGYVDSDTTQSHIDIALMKRALGRVVETRQTDTAQIHSDNNALMKRASDTTKACQLAIPIATLVIFAVVGVLFSIPWIEQRDKRRKAFTQNTISKINSQYTNYNWVICHSPYSVGFDGVEGTDWGYTHHELDISSDRTIGYDLYWARSGTFYRHGDGGFINWAYGGNVLGTEDSGATVHFGTRS